MSSASMFNEAMFQEILLLSSGDMNDYVVHIKENMQTWMEAIKLTDTKKLCNMTNFSN